MVADQTMTPRFTWGDAVHVRLDAPSHLRPGAAGDICGFRTVESEEAAQEFGVDLSSILYIIEYSDGSSLEIPEKYLVPFDCS